MNVLTSTIVWMSGQVALFSLVGCGLFFMLRRRGPRAGATCTAIVLGLSVVLALLAVSPWPRWTLSDLKTAPPVQHELSHVTVGSPIITDSTASVVDKGAADVTVSMFSVWWSTAMDFLRAPSNAAASAAASQSAWRTWLPIVLAAGIALCLVRLAVGIWAVRRLRIRSQLIEDEGVSRMVHEMAIAVGSPAVELRQSSLLRSAATVGWRRPLLLLPCDWQSWTETERRAVLAHELVHVAQRDYATGLIARLAMAIHFYQPLVLWLSRQLRIQQELAADSQAAILSGDRQTYLTTLAQMALRADEQPLPWAARAFLPGTSSLIKRVAWLKRKGSPMEKSLSRKSRWILGAAMAAIALAVAGIRGPSESNSSLLAQTTQNQPDQKSGELKLHVKGEGTITITGEGQAGVWKLGDVKLDSLHALDYIPADAKLIVAVSPSELFKVPSLAKVLPMFDEIDKQNKLGVKFAALADVVVIKTGTGPKVDRLILRYTKPFDWKAVVTKNVANLETKRVGDKEYYAVNMAALSDAERAPWRGGVWASNFYVPDDRTLIIGSDEALQKIIRGGEKLMSPEVFPALATSPIAARVETSLLRDLGALDMKQNFEANPVAAMFLPLVEQTKVTTLAGKVAASNSSGKDLAGFTLSIECDSPEAAQAVAKTLEAARTLASNIVTAKKDALRESVGSVVKSEDMQLAGEFIATISKALADTQVKADAATVTASTNIDIAPPMIGAAVIPALAASREAAMRAETMNNLKQLALAMFWYEDAKQHFPPASIRDKDGKPLLSWRVAVLPHIEQQALYDQFHLDEPWDSEYNRKLLDRMPTFFRDPHEDAGSTNASYFMPTGRGMFGGSEDGMKPLDIKDGTSNTIMLVESKRAIPWTKPEDIEIELDPAKPLPKFGGHLVPDGLFAAAYADGHVECISGEVDPKFLHGLFTIAGGEPAFGAPAAPKASGTSGPSVLKSGDRSFTPALPENPGELRKSNERPVRGTSGQNRVKLELHRAEIEAADGLTESPVMGESQKIYLHPEAEITNDDIQGASAKTDNAGQPVIHVALTVEGAKKMAAVSKQHMQKPLAIVLDGRVVMAPRIMSEMSGGVQITGNLTKEAAERLADGLNAK